MGLMKTYSRSNIGRDNSVKGMLSVKRICSTCTCYSSQDFLFTAFKITVGHIQCDWPLPMF